MHDLPSTYTKLRNLDGLEKVFWLLDQNFNTHFSIVADVAGNAPVEMWSDALNTAGRLSPLIASQIVTGADGTPIFIKGPPRAVPVTVIEGDQDEWGGHVAAEQSVGFDVANEPLARARLLHGADRSILILTFHHAIADGASATHFMREVLRGASGAEVTLQGGTASVEQLLERSDLQLPAPVQSASTARIPVAQYRSDRGREPTVTARQLSQALTSRLRERARGMEATVHGMLSAAASLAFSQARPAHPVLPPRVFTPMNPRARLLGGIEHLGVHVGGMIARNDDPDATFWKQARYFTREVAAATEPVALGLSITAVRKVIADVGSVDVASAIWAHAFGAEILLTNLAMLDIPIDYGPLRLDHLWGPAVSIGISQEQSIGVITIGGSMHLLHTSHEPIDGFLDTMIATLEAAAG